MAAPRSLTSRLVVTVVVLVAAVTLAVVALTTVAMRGYLTDRLDDQVRDSFGGARVDAGPREPWDGHGRFDDGPDDRFGQRSGTLQAEIAADGTVTAGLLSPGGMTALSEDDLDELDDVPADGRVHELRLHAGDYRVIASDVGDRVVIGGLPSSDITRTLAQLLVLGGLIALLGVGLAVAAGTLLVRRQLRPLHQVADAAHHVARMPLDHGEVGVTARVPARLTDEATEVGQVGAALNSLLEHVETSLAARHRSEQQVRRFVADASHELRTPLATILGYAELAERRPDDPAATAAALDKVRAEGGRMRSLVEDLLLLARLDSGRPLERQPVDLTRLMLEAVEDALVLAPDHVWRLDLPDTAVETVGDEQRLHQVATNLLTNARKYTPPGSTVTVRVRPGELVVHDDGPGFPDDLVDHAFERFVRGDSARTRGTDSGAGLGLSLVAAIVAAHGGSVQLRSRPGDTAVTVRLP